MFIKITKSGNYKYAQAVKSFKQKGVVRHKVLFNLGRLDVIYNNPTFQNFAKRLAELSNAAVPANLEAISEAEIVNWGYIAYKKIWEDFSLDRILSDIAAGTKISFDLGRTCFLMAASHLLSPSSKLSVFNNQDKYFKLDPVGLNDLYRSLDILAGTKEKIESQIFDTNRNLFNLNVYVVFYYATTFSFSSCLAD